MILLSHGQSEYNAVERIGGDSGLTEDGLNYARKLAEFVEEKVGGTIKRYVPYNCLIAEV